MTSRGEDEMISIVNVSCHNNELKPEKYVIKINREVVGEFEHYRNEGLITCLRKAADALEIKYNERKGK